MSTKTHHLSHPTLLIIGGFAGAGKSTLARRLGKTLSIPVFEQDHIAKTIHTSESFNGTSPEAGGVSFDLLFSFAEKHLLSGGSLIFDQNLGHARTWANINRLRLKLGNQAEIRVFILDCPWELCLERFAARAEQPNIDDVTLDDLADHKFKWDYLNDNELPQAIRIDATQTPDKVFEQLAKHLA